MAIDATSAASASRESSSSSSRPRRIPGDTAASIVLIGFRGVGKSTLGLIIATHLRRNFVDADRVLSRVAGCSPTEYVRQHSWESFRDLETELLGKILSEHARGYVIACGGGVVEREENRTLLLGHVARGGLVIHMTREKEEVIRYLINERDRPQWGEEIRSVWARRFPLFEACSTHSYVTLTVRQRQKAPALKLKEVEQDCLRYIDLLLSSSPPEFRLDARTYSLSIDCTTPQNINYDAIRTASGGVDALELRVDSLRRPATMYQTSPDTPAANPGCPDLTYISFTIAHLRRVSRLPIVYSVRTLKQDGLFDLREETVEQYIRLCEAAYKCGVEFIELELGVGESLLRQIFAKKPPYMRVILSHIDIERRLTWDSPETISIFEAGRRTGADLIKIVLYAGKVEDNLLLHRFHEKVQSDYGSGEAGTRSVAHPTLIACNLGPSGQMSSLFNTVLTQVYHPCLPFPVAQGVPTFSNVQKALLACGISHSRRITIAGRTDAVQRASTAFRRALEELSLPYTVTERSMPVDDGVSDVPVLSVGEEQEQHQSKLTNGTASSSWSSEAAAWIGHADTTTNGPAADSLAVPQSGHHSSTPRRELHNAQAAAIAEAISASLSPINAVTDVSVALLVGAHGTSGREAAFALFQLGIRQILCLGCEQALVNSNENTFLDLDRSASSDGRSASAGRVLPTIVVAFAALSMRDIEKHHRLFASPTGGAVLDLVTAPPPQTDDTTLIGPVLVRCSKYPDSWITVTPDEVEQARLRVQFRLITGRALAERPPSPMQ